MTPDNEWSTIDTSQSQNKEEDKVEFEIEGQEEVVEEKPQQPEVQAKPETEEVIPEKKPEAWEDEKFITYIKDVENAPLMNKDKNFKHKSVEGGTDTIGFGHKLTQNELKTGLVYGYDINNLNREAVEDILRKDLKAKNQILINLYGKKYKDLDYRRKQMLLDFQFNVKNFKDKNVFPKFKEALFAGDEVGMEKEYKRYYKNKLGKMKLLARNKKFKDLFFVDKD